MNNINNNFKVHIVGIIEALSSKGIKILRPTKEDNKTDEFNEYRGSLR